MSRVLPLQTIVLVLCSLTSQATPVTLHGESPNQRRPPSVCIDPLPPVLSNTDVRTQPVPRLAGEHNGVAGVAPGSSLGVSRNQGINTPFASYSLLATAVPEPTSLLLMGTGLVSIAAWLRRRRKAKATRGKAESISEAEKSQ